ENTPCAQITRQHIADALAHYESRGKIAELGKMRQTVIDLMGFGVSRNMLPVSPVAGIDLCEGYAEAKKGHRPAVTEPADIGELMRKVDAYQDRGLAKQALLLVSLTFVRPAVALEAEWSEIDLDKAIWVVPFAKLKMRKQRAKAGHGATPFCVPLSRQ